MNIIEKTYSLNGKLDKRKSTDLIILHHAVYNGDVEGIDRIHKNKGWTCIGYHFYVRKDGSIYRGRQEDSVGAHAYGQNYNSVGICFEGNFETDIMGSAQIEAGKWLVSQMKSKYNISKVIGHKEVNSTACPGRNFPLTEIKNSIPSAVIPNTCKELQGLLGVAVDGIYGANTKNAVARQNIRKGKKGEIVKFVQRRLVAKGYSVIVDGIFGNDTHNKVISLQQAYKISRDGIVGKDTMEKLI